MAVKRVENAMIGDHPDQALDITEHLPSGLDRTIPGDWPRHRLDHALALIRTRSSDKATDVLDDLRERAPHWLRYQQYGRDVVRELLQSRPRTLTERHRTLADFMNIPA